MQKTFNTQYSFESNSVSELTDYIYTKLTTELKSIERIKQKLIDDIDKRNMLNDIITKTNYQSHKQMIEQYKKDFIDTVSVEDFNYCLNSKEFNIEIFLSKDSYDRRHTLEYGLNEKIRKILLSKGLITEKEFHSKR